MCSGSEYPMIMATIHVPFKTPLEIKETIARLEEKFADRYTEQDPWYRHTVQEGHRLVVRATLSVLCTCAHPCLLCSIPTCTCEHALHVSSQRIFYLLHITDRWRLIGNYGTFYLPLYTQRTATCSASTTKILFPTQARCTNTWVSLMLKMLPISLVLTSHRCCYL